MAASGSFTPTKYDVTLSPDYSKESESFRAKAVIHVNVTGGVSEFDLKISPNVTVESVSFSQAAHISRGHPRILGQTANFTVSDDTVHVTLLGEITEESIREAGFIEVEYKGDYSSFAAVDFDTIAIQTNLTEGNVNAFVPILEDVPVSLKLTIAFAYLANIESNLEKGDVVAALPSEFRNEFSSESIKLSDVNFTVYKPNH